MMSQLPPDVRPKAYAITVLVLDLFYAVQTYFKVDLETAIILLCVNEATMRPFVADDFSIELRSAAEVPDELRGAISRRMIADKTGIPRETVRRKVSELVELGLLKSVGDGEVRAETLLSDPALQSAIQTAHKAIARYSQFLSALDEHGGPGA